MLLLLRALGLGELISIQQDTGDRSPSVSLILELDALDPSVFKQLAEGFPRPVITLLLSEAHPSEQKCQR